MKENNIKDIVQAVAAGSHEAFRTLYDLFYLKIYRFVHYFLPKTSDCESVVAEVFFIIWDKRRLLKEVINVEAYFYRISRNEAFHYIKKNKDHTILSLEDMPVELSVLSSPIDDRVIENEMMQIYQSAIDTLPERCKLIFLMVREQKMSHKEIAEILSIKTGTIEVQMNIAIKKITAVVRKYYPTLIK